MFKKFMSIANSAKYGFSYDTEAWDSKSNPFLEQKFRMFETYGDGLCQHSGDWPVSEEFAIDYMESLAVAMSEDKDLCRELYYTLGQKPSDDKLAFAASIIYGEKDKEWTKRRYYSISLEKITRNREKEHDTRYKEIAEWNNGTPSAIFGVILPEYADGLEKWQYAQRVREWCDVNLKNGYMEMPAVFLKWFKEKSDAAREFRDAFECCWNIAQSYTLRQSALNHIQNHRERIEVRAAQAEAMKAEQEKEETAAEPEATAAEEQTA